MCESPFLDAAKKKGQEYEFSLAFQEMKKICKESDFIIANLESPCAGSESSYTQDVYLFNTPDSFVDAIKEMGVSLVLTANNHCYDRGEQGVERTRKILDERHIKHNGTYSEKEEYKPEIVKLGECTFAVISCTDSTNPITNRYEPTIKTVNLMKKQSSRITNKKAKVKHLLIKLLGRHDNYFRLRKMIGLPPMNSYADRLINVEEVDIYLERICEQIRFVKEKVDFVFVCPHMGGQFNLIPGDFCEYAMKKFVDAGANAVIASHPHVIQKAELIKNIPCFFSIGNVSMSMSTSYILRENYPEYGMMVHFYIENKVIYKITYSIIKMIEDENGYLFVVPVCELWKQGDEKQKNGLLKEIEKIIRRIMQDDQIILETVIEEYTFMENGKGVKNIGEFLNIG